MTAVRTVPTAGLIGLVGLFGLLGLLAGLAATVGLGAAAWAAGMTYGVIGWAVLASALTPAPISAAISAPIGDTGGFGPADWVTLTRAALVGGVVALSVESVTVGSVTVGSMTVGSMTVESVTGPRPALVPVLVGLATVALVLDAVDGAVARRTGTASSLGARFDMEVDAFLLLVLSAYLARAVGPWVLAIGAMRYAFVVAGWVLPWMRERLPARYWRKVVAATQGIVLVIAASGVLPTTVTVAALVVALGLLLESFGRDVVWLWQRRRVTV